jgi:integrase
MARKRRCKIAVVPYRNHPQFRWKIAGLYVAGKRVRRFFKTKIEAQNFIDDLEIKAENLGTRATHIDQRLHVMAVECYDRLAPLGKTLADATEFYCKHLHAVQGSCTLDDLVAGFLQTKESDGASKRWLQDLKSRIGKFQRTFGKRIVATITVRDCDDWLRNLRLSPITRNNFRRILRVLFGYAVNHSYCAENPLTKTAKARVIDKPVEVLTPEQTRRLLESATPEILPYIAIGAFAGLRRAELLRLDWSEIHLDRAYIEISAAKSKTASRRLVKILPNLKAWLQPLAQARGPVAPPNVRVKLEAASKRAGIKDWPQNGLRHSYGSYHLARFEDAASTALQMGHVGAGVLFRHYREVVTPDAADSYWRILPVKSV